MNKPVSSTALATNLRKRVLADGKHRDKVLEVFRGKASEQLYLRIGMNGQSAEFTRQEQLPLLQLCPVASTKGPTRDREIICHGSAQTSRPNQRALRYPQDCAHLPSERKATAARSRSSDRCSRPVLFLAGCSHSGREVFPEKPAQAGPVYTCNETSRSRGRTVRSRCFPAP